LPLFFFLAAISARGQTARGAKTPCKRLFSFSGGVYLSPTAKRAKRSKKSRENGNRTHNAQRNTAHGRKISPYKPEKAQAPPTTPPTAKTPRKRPKNGIRGKAHGGRAGADTVTGGKDRGRAAGADHLRRHNLPRVAGGYEDGRILYYYIYYRYAHAHTYTRAYAYARPRARIYASVCRRSVGGNCRGSL
jgi:hypothetical protein